MNEDFERLRRLRRTSGLRRLVRETRLHPADLILPLFVSASGEKKAIGSMPGVFQLPIEEAVREGERAQKAGLGAVILFGLPRKKDASGSDAYSATGIVQQAVKQFKKSLPDLPVITDLCLCEYTTHGHCGVLLKGGKDVDNDATLPLLARAALAQARAGADIVAPSGMMDGAVAAIREALDAEGFTDLPILAYSAKFASVFYGPFREAAESAPSFGDRRSYQMDPANAREALREIRADVAQGADMVMVKPALPYLDIIARIRPELDVPLVAYNVSGEFAMVKAAEKLGWLDGAADQRAALEILTSIRRAGADLIITYHALEAAAALRA
jgi:porphobilinogen synthase